MEQNDLSLVTKIQGWTRRIAGRAPGRPAPTGESDPKEPANRRGPGDLTCHDARTDPKHEDLLFLLAVCMLIDPYRTMVH
jgi:hypothetical protein